MNLQQLAFAHSFYRNRADLKKSEFFVQQRKKETSGKKVVPHQNSRLIFPGGIYRGNSAARIRVVNHIIVDQCRGMEELNQGGGTVGARVNSTTCFCRKENEKRPDLFPFLTKDIAGNEIYEPDIRTDGGLKLAVELPDLFFYGQYYLV